MADTISDAIIANRAFLKTDAIVDGAVDVEVVDSDCLTDPGCVPPAEGRSGARASLADRHVGNRIRERRVMLGLSQQQLAALIGVTYQQAHKYERGLNRISAGRLYEIALNLNVDVSWFFEGLQTESGVAGMTPRQRMCLELARNFAAIDNERHQEALSHLARALAQAGI